MNINERKSNFELLRIVAILLIISFHYVFKSEYIIYTLNVNTFLIKVFWFFGELGVNLFILITGYFMVTEKVSNKRVLLLVIETFFYNLLNVILNYFFAGEKIEVLDILFPVILNRYWFITTYLVLYIISPYLNILIKNMKKIEYLKLLLILISLWCIIPTVFGITTGSSETCFNYTRLVWFIVLYFIGSYIRLYGINTLKKRKNVLIISLITFILMLISIPIIYKISIKTNRIIEYAYLWTPNNVFMLILSVCIFYYFSILKMKSIKFINILASTTFGIYLLHDGVFNKYLWNNIFRTKFMLASSYAVFHIFFATTIIFIVGVIIDLLRQKIEKYTFEKIIDKCAIIIIERGLIWKRKE